MATNSMDELSRLLRLQQYQRRKQRDAQARFEKLQASSEVRRRILKGQHELQTSLVDSIRTGNKNDFRSIHDAYRDLRSWTQALIDEQDLPFPLASGAASMHENDTTTTFPSLLSDISRDNILQFISHTISDPTFVEHRLLTLTQQQLEELVQAHRCSPANSTSVLGPQSNSTRGRTESIFSVGHDSRAPHRILDAFRHDGLALLLDLVGTSTPSVGPAYMQREMTWAKICARMISEKRPGNEKFIIEVIDHFATNTDPTGKRALENWLVETLRDGHFLLDQTYQPPPFKLKSDSGRKQGGQAPSPAEDFQRIAIRKLFRLLSHNAETGIIPQRALKLCRLITTELKDNPAACRTATLLLITRWLFSSFLPDHIITPESRGLLLTYYFPETARHRILRDIALRAQQMAFDALYSWSHAPPSDAELKTDIEIIIALFRPRKRESAAMSGPPPSAFGPSKSFGSRLRCLCPADLLTLMHTLFPDLRHCLSGHSIEGQAAEGAARISALPFRSGAHRSQTEFTSTATSSVHDDIDDAVQSPNAETQGGNSVGVSRLDRGAALTFADTTDSDTQATLLSDACLELKQVLHHDVLDGSYNPLKEAWTSLEISAGSVRWIYPPEDDTDIGASEQHSSSDSEDEAYEESAASETLYLNIRHAVFKLLRKGLPLHGQTPKHGVIAGYQDVDFEANPSNPFRPSSGIRSRSDSNPYRKRSPKPDLSEFESIDFLSTTLPLPRHALQTESLPSSLPTYLDDAIKHYQLEEDFVKAYKYTRILDRVNQIASVSSRTSFPLVRYFTRDARKMIEESYVRIRKSETSIAMLEQQLKDDDSAVQAMDAVIEGLRIKMWYCTDVRSASQYEELTKVVTALASMGQPKQPVPERIAYPPLRHKATIRPRDQARTKAASAVVEIMAAEEGHGGPMKLSDNQVSVTVTFMQKQGIETICPGEERIHRMFCEISRCISHLIGTDAANSSVLWSSELFQRDRMDGEAEAFRIDMQNSDDRSVMSIARPASSGSDIGHHDRVPSLRRKSYFNIASVSNRSQDSQHDYFDNRSPTLTTRSSNTFWSPSSLSSPSSTSMTSVPSRTWSPKNLRQSVSRDSFQSASNVRSLMTALRQSLTNLFVSDVLNQSFPNGSETDAAFFGTLAGQFAQQLAIPAVITGPSQGEVPQDTASRTNKAKRTSGSHLKESVQKSPEKRQSKVMSRETDKAATGQSGARLGTAPATGSFSLDEACKKLLHRFELFPSPFTKLKALHDLETIMLASVSPPQTDVGAPARTAPELPPLSSPRLNHKPSSTLSPRLHSRRETSVRCFQDLFRNPNTRPRGLYLNLQTIASLVPTEVLDSSSRGRTFWNATIAALSLKQEMCASMVETADQIISYHTANRGHSQVSSAAQRQRDTAAFSSATYSTDGLVKGDAPDISRYSMADAAQLLVTTAKEGHPVAQRELATLYLTHPELLDKVMPPLSRSTEVYKDNVMGSPGKSSDSAANASKSRVGGTTAGPSTGPAGAGGGVGESDPHRYDPATLCLAHHWMERSAKGGDLLAQKYLQAKDEIERIP